MTEIGPKLRALIVHARKDPKWGKPKGLSQQELAAKAGTSQVWLRQIETGYTNTAKADTLGNICYVLGIDPDLIRAIGYPDVADSIEASRMLTEHTLPEHSDHEPAELHIRGTPGLTEREKALLVDALHAIRQQEPIGQDLWRAKKRRKAEKAS